MDEEKLRADQIKLGLEELKALIRVLKKNRCPESKIVAVLMENITETRIITELKEQMCDQYCKYTGDNNLNQRQLHDLCKCCPLNKI